VSVRAARGTELSALAVMMAASPLLQRYRTTLESATAALSDAYENGDGLLCVGEPIAGFAWLSFAPRVLNGAAYLRLLLVLQPGAGVGAELLQAAEAVGRERGMRHMYLLCTTDNTAGQRFYQRHGYRHVGDLPGLVWPDLDEALYEKRLND
jgi:GNAT superfamily N-acetyltransferase